ncbi:MAG: DHA2 family efflux MFS transporter permease subunit [Streptosporangiaceae bacterium]|nr:DHA2 family efflux MFS transporter permease subunit [Streptosporangiaceae bacterium]MBV9856545.1 DHA2 family efflux MFS transporter permease subunit [Streptosporangiaceae bacterium]
MAAAPANPAAEKLDPVVVRAALILIVGAMAVIFDTTIVSVALHTLSVKLGTSVATIQWVTTGYLLALGIAVPLSTWGLQRFGGKRLWMFSLAVFLVGSVGSSLAWDVGSLIGWRVIQGIGGGLMLPVMTTLIFQAAGGKSLGRLVTYVALPALLGPILGPLIGGAILTHLSWRFMFWVNVPFCAIGILLAWRYLNIDAPARPAPAFGKPRLDVPGLFLIAPGTSVVLLGLANAGTAAGFTHPDVIIPLGVGVMLLAAFTGYALRTSRPLVEVRLLGRQPVASSSAVLFFSGFSLYGAMLLMPLYYQDVRGTTALTAGVMLVPQGIGTVLSRTVAGGNIDRFGSRVIALAGFAVVTAATVPFALAGPHTSEWLLAVWMVIRGFGLGAVTMPVMVAGYIGLDKQQIPHSSVLTRTAQQIGGSFGTAVLAVILEGAITAHPATPADAFHVAFWWSACFSALAVLLSLWLPGAQRAPEASRGSAPGQHTDSVRAQQPPPATTPRPGDIPVVPEESPPSVWKNKISVPNGRWLYRSRQPVSGRSEPGSKPMP